MIRADKNKWIMLALYALLLAGFFGFFLYMFTAERLDVYHAEQTHHYAVLEGMEREIVEDDTAPVGIRKIYRGTLDPALCSESCLCFNIAHHDIELYIDDQLAYSLHGAESNRVGENVGNNWCSVHVGEDHAGQTVKVVLTPRVEAAMDKEPTFLLGSHYAIAVEVLSNDLLQIVLCALCVMLGVLLILADLYVRWVIRTGTNGMVFLGVFSAVLGLWKLFDLNVIPMLMPGKSMALNYISVGSLFLTGPCLLAYLSSLFYENKRGFMMAGICGSALVCLYALAAQLLGIAELRQNLLLSHIMLIFAVVSMAGAAVFNRIVHKETGLRREWALILIVVAGITVDLLNYYRHNDNGSLSFSTIGFLVYTLITFLLSIHTVTRNAYTDAHTGLVNRARWNALMHRTEAIPEPYAILVIDLNGLKRVNDQLGHEAGDKMIFQLSNMLRNTLPRTSVICRWGGDEFTALLTGVGHNQMTHHIDTLMDAQKAYNTAHPELPIHFAVGAALSSDHPGCSRLELFQKADEEMYRNKQLWYAHRE